MPDQKSVSPLLDGFTIGTPVNDHFGVCCYPAVKEDSQRKYIVKVISIPASQTQLDALLITGACKDPADAAEYFRGRSDEVVQEAEFLKAMSRLEGFIPYEGFQVEPMLRNRIGYEVSLLSGFRLSLERYMHRSNVTHLEAVNLGIDLCTALAACRRAGMLYIDLKPSNVFISTKKEYKIGDLGFAALDSLQYSSMPAKYRSCYTAPELMDDLSVISTTADTYALGMILYQIFNNGALPEDSSAPLPAPANADEAMAAILLKACAPKPEDRWEDPVQMGQALVDYMQAGTINDTPIMAPITGSTLGRTGAGYETTKFPVPEQSAEPATPEQEPEAAAQTPAQEEAVPTVEPQEEVSPAEEPQEEALAGETDAPEEAPVAEETPVEAPQEEPDGESAEIEAALAAEFAKLTGQKEEPEAEPTIDSERLDSELSELRQILSTPKQEPAAVVTRKEENITPVVVQPEKKKKSFVSILFTILLISLLLAGSVWGYMFYTTAYIQSVQDLRVEGALDRVTVIVDSKLPDGTLTAVCSDSYGNAKRQTVRGGKAEFRQMNPGTFYTIQLETSGLHKLEGPISAHYTTESVTTVAEFSASIGPYDGTAVLNLIVEGHMPDQWKVHYIAEGEPELAQTFAGSSTTIDALIIGKTYTFRLETVNGEAVNGNSTTQLKATRVINPKNVQVVSCADGVLTVAWDSDLASEADTWVVRCVGENYDQLQEVTGMEASFTGISPDLSYTVEVASKGMPSGDRVSVSPAPINLFDFAVDESDRQQLTLSWNYDGKAPDNGFLVQYTVDGSDMPNVVPSEGSTAVISPKVPGATYHFSIQAGETSVLNGKQDFTCAPATPFKGYNISYNNLSLTLLPTPEGEWNYSTVANTLDTDVFTSGQSISAIMASTISFWLESAEVRILYVFRDENGSVMPELIAEETVQWQELWNRNDHRHTELNPPVSPSKPGHYTLEVYFNSMAAASAEFTIQ